jgi:hypothetical protein
MSLLNTKNMTKEDNATIYLKYKTLEDLLKVILYSSQSVLGAIPLLYHISYTDKEILFIQTSGVRDSTIHYILVKEKPGKKFIELKRLTGEFNFVDRLGNDGMSLYVPVLDLEKSTLTFP